MRQEFAKVNKNFEKLATMIKKSFDDVDKRFEKTAAKEDLKGVEKTMATKKDLEKFATKSELREELKRFATKKDLKKHELGKKDFIEDKLADLKGDLVVLMTKEDNKIRQLIATS